MTDLQIENLKKSVDFWSRPENQALFDRYAKALSDEFKKPKEQQRTAHEVAKALSDELSDEFKKRETRKD